MTENQQEIVRDMYRELENIVNYGTLPESTRERLKELLDRAYGIERWA